MGGWDFYFNLYKKILINFKSGDTFPVYTMDEPKIKLAYFTSFREIIGDEQVSKIVIDPETTVNYGYRLGNLEAMALDIQKGESDFAKTFELVMIFSDDNAQEFQESKDSVHKWPLDIKSPAKQIIGIEVPVDTLEDLLVRVPSEPWRIIKDPNQKALQKALYEQQFLNVINERQVDLVFSDSYRPLFSPRTVNANFGHIVNIHPAILNKESPYRLPGITPTRDAFTRLNYGYVIVDDKKDRDIWPKGEVIEVEYQGKVRVAVKVPRHNKTGVTVHVINEKVDDGPIIIDEVREINAADTYEQIREGNYQLKMELLPKALMHYVQSFRLGGADVSDMILVRRESLLRNGPTQTRYGLAQGPN